MAIITKTVKIAHKEEVRLHLSAGKKFSVEILEGRGTVRMRRVIHGVQGQAFLDVNFLFCKTSDCIPFARIFATTLLVSGTEIRYRIRTGSDMTGSPEISG